MLTLKMLNLVHVVIFFLLSFVSLYNLHTNICRTTIDGCNEYFVILRKIRSNLLQKNYLKNKSNKHFSFNCFLHIIFLNFFLCILISSVKFSTSNNRTSDGPLLVTISPLRKAMFLNVLSYLPTTAANGRVATKIFSAPRGTLWCQLRICFPGGKFNNFKFLTTFLATVPWR